MFNMLIMGPPGAGKGTQAQDLAKRFSLRHLASGDVVRSEVDGGTPKGLEANEYMKDGKLVPDVLMTSMVADQIKVACESSNGVVLDGYPRTLPQAESLTKILGECGIEMRAVVNLKVPGQEILDRLVFRLTCHGCNRVYHRNNNPPKVEGICDDCGKGLKIRPDDNEQVIRERLRVYEEQTAPVLKYYEERGLLKEFDGTPPIGEVFQCVVQYLQKLGAE